MVTLFFSLANTFSFCAMHSTDTQTMSQDATKISEPTAQSTSRLCSSIPTSSDQVSLLDNEQEHVASPPQKGPGQDEYVKKRRYLRTTYVVLGCYLIGNASLRTATLR